MNKNSLLGPWIRRFLLEHLVGERNLAHNTQVSYRDTLVLFLPFVAKNLKPGTWRYDDRYRWINRFRHGESHLFHSDQTSSIRYNKLDSMESDSKFGHELLLIGKANKKSHLSPNESEVILIWIERSLGGEIHFRIIRKYTVIRRASYNCYGRSVGLIYRETKS